MKKVFSFVLACVLLFSAAFASEAETVSFGDFSLVLDSGLNVVTGEKVHNQVFMMIYCDDYPAASLNAVYMENHLDLTTVPADSMNAYVEDSLVPGFQSAGYKTENLQQLTAGTCDLNGLPALCVMFSLDIYGVSDDTAQKSTLIYTQVLVSLSDCSYWFTITANSEHYEGLLEYMSIVNTLTWN